MLQVNSNCFCEVSITDFREVISECLPDVNRTIFAT